MRNVKARFRTYLAKMGINSPDEYMHFNGTCWAELTLFYLHLLHRVPSKLHESYVFVVYIRKIACE